MKRVLPADEEQEEGKEREREGRALPACKQPVGWHMAGEEYHWQNAEPDSDDDEDKIATMRVGVGAMLTSDSPGGLSIQALRPAASSWAPAPPPPRRQPSQPSPLPLLSGGAGAKEGATLLAGAGAAPAGLSMKLLAKKSTHGGPSCLPSPTSSAGLTRDSHCHFVEPAEEGTSSLNTEDRATGSLPPPAHKKPSQKPPVDKSPVDSSPAHTPSSAPQHLAEKLPIGVDRRKRGYAARIVLPLGKKSNELELELGVYDTVQQAAEVFDAFAHGHNFSCNVHAREQDLLDTNFARPQPIAYLEHRTLLDRRVAIWWKDEQRWFYGKLARYDVPTAEFQNGSFKVDYDDGDDEEGIELGDGVGDAEVAVLPAWWTGLKMKLAA
mmetsp:Transcript_3856/g.9980  ORF Transcript_3856/g.9980 Transcript_3856/m.9980 type:complete len:381 (+) Transcript_3856:2304-3446(+)